MTTKIDNDSLNDIVGKPTGSNLSPSKNVDYGTSPDVPTSTKPASKRKDQGRNATGTNLAHTSEQTRLKNFDPSSNGSFEPFVTSHAKQDTSYASSINTHPNTTSAPLESSTSTFHDFIPPMESGSARGDYSSISSSQVYADSDDSVNIGIESGLEDDNVSSLKRIRYTLGLFSLAFVIVTWVASSVMIQKILDTYEKPVFMTYCFSSLFMGYFPVYFLQEACKKHRIAKRRRERENIEETQRLLHASNLGYSFADATVAIDAPDTSIFSATTDYSRVGESTQASPTIESATIGDEMEGLEPLVGELPPPGVLNNTLPKDSDEIVYAGFWEHVRVACILAPLWFSMNIMFNLALNLTSVASNTVLTNTSSLFVLVINFFAFKERPGWIPVIGAICTIGGAALVSFADDEDGGDDSHSTADILLGDMITIISAIVYAAYTILMENKVGKQEHRINITYIFACIGLVNTLVMWPVIVGRHYLEFETFQLPDTHALLWMFINGLVGTALSDYMWGQAVVLTSPLLCTLGLSLTTPLGMFSDWFFHDKQFKLMYIVGCVILVGGFLLVNYKYTNEIAVEEQTLFEEEAQRNHELAEVIDDDMYRFKSSHDYNDLETANQRVSARDASMSMSMRDGLDSNHLSGRFSSYSGVDLADENDTSGSESDFESDHGNVGSEPYESSAINWTTQVGTKKTRVSESDLPESYGDRIRHRNESGEEVKDVYGHIAAE